MILAYEVFKILNSLFLEAVIFVDIIQMLNNNNPSGIIIYHACIGNGLVYCWHHTIFFASDLIVKLLYRSQSGFISFLFLFFSLNVLCLKTFYIREECGNFERGLLFEHDNIVINFLFIVYYLWIFWLFIVFISD